MRSGLALLFVGLCAACTFAPAAETVPPLTPSASPTAEPTTEPTPAPTATPEPTAAPTTDPAALDLRAIGCNGGVVLEWSPSRHPDFSFYLGLRSPESEIAPQYPPIAPAVDWGDLYATDPFVTSGFDASIIPTETTWHYRVMAYDTAGRVVSRSPVASARLHPVEELELAVEPAAEAEGRTVLRWTPFDGEPGCFSSYRVLFGTGGVANTLLTTISSPTQGELDTAALHPGVTYTFRVQAVRTTTLGYFVVGQSDPVSYLVPAAGSEP